MPAIKDKNSNEWYFSSDEYILSETDEHGMILYANNLFCEIAGYKIEELIGEPHNIVRHLDMPKIAFKGLWKDIRSKGFWTGVVKNKRKDDGFYWVHSTVLRRIQTNGKITYLSVRVVPDRATVNACISLYSELKSKE